MERNTENEITWLTSSLLIFFLLQPTVITCKESVQSFYWYYMYTYMLIVSYDFLLLSDIKLSPLVDDTLLPCMQGYMCFDI